MTAPGQHLLDVPNGSRQLEVRSAGLSGGEAANHLSKYGSNKIVPCRAIDSWQL